MSTGLRVAWARPRTTTAADAGAVAALGVGQARRLVGLAADRRDAFVTGRLLVRRLLVEAGDEPAVTSVCGRCGADHGPLVAVSGRTLLSVSYADGVVAVAAAPAAAGALGVDVELDDAATRSKVREATAHWRAPGRRDVAGWTRAEAALKADGRGVRVDPARIRWRRHADGWRARLPGDGIACLVRPVAGPRGAVISVAVGRA